MLVVVAEEEEGRRGRKTHFGVHWMCEGQRCLLGEEYDETGF